MKKLSEMVGGTLLYSEDLGRLVTANILWDEIENAQVINGKYYTVHFNDRSELVPDEEVDVNN